MQGFLYVWQVSNEPGIEMDFPISFKHFAFKAPSLNIVKVDHLPGLTIFQLILNICISTHILFSVSHRFQTQPDRPRLHPTRCKGLPIYPADLYTDISCSFQDTPMIHLTTISTPATIIFISLYMVNFYIIYTHYQRKYFYYTLISIIPIMSSLPNLHLYFQAPVWCANMFSVWLSYSHVQAF